MGDNCAHLGVAAGTPLIPRQSSVVRWPELLVDLLPAERTDHVKAKPLPATSMPSSDDADVALEHRRGSRRHSLHLALNVQLPNDPSAQAVIVAMRWRAMAPVADRSG
jgi:hypothetical protein